MKFPYPTIRKYVFLFGILLVAGCSSLIITPITSRLAEANTPISPSSETTARLPLNRKIAFIYSNGSGYYNEIYVMNEDGSDLQNITPPDLPQIGCLVWSPDGEYIAFNAIAGNKAQIYSLRVDGTDLKQLTFGEEHAYSPSWSPDGKYIVYSSFQKDVLDYHGNLAQLGYIMKPDGSGARRLWDGNEVMGESVAFRYDNFISVAVPASRYTERVFTIDLNGNIQKKFPELILDGTPVWSPDGNLAVYNTIRADCSGLIVMNPDGSNQTCLKIAEITNSNMYLNGASWSPDSKYIIFSSNIDIDWDIYMIKPDGTGFTRLTNLPGDESSPIWSR